MNNNDRLHEARRNPRDEFYTQLTDIEKEMRHYRSYFKGKVVYANCDDAYESNFFKYFALNFNRLGLKKLITTSYVGSPIANVDFIFEEDGATPPKTAYAIEINEVKDLNGDGAVDMADVDILLQNDENASHVLKGDGSYDSPECLEFLKEADVIVSNPPFSKFRDYFTMLMKYEKDFIIMGNMNAASCKEIRPYFAQNKAWWGASLHGQDVEFRVPDDYEVPATSSRYRIDENGKKFFSLGVIRWYTNLEHNKRKEELILFQKYTPELHPTYANYDAIEVSKVKDIPGDYAGEMGVPITFLDKWNPNQFEIIGFMRDVEKTTDEFGKQDFFLNGKPVYIRIVIKNRNPE